VLLDVVVVPSFVLFGSGDVIFGADGMLALLQYVIDTDDVFLRCTVEGCKRCEQDSGGWVWILRICS
jgi:hypothetical protein